MSGLIRVGVLDEHEVVRQGLRYHLADQSGIEVTGLFETTDSAWQAIEQGHLDLLVMDNELEHSAAQDFIKALRAQFPHIWVLVVVPEADPRVAMLLLAAGVQGVVCKRQPLGVFIRAIEMLACGQRYLCSSIVVAQENDTVSTWWEATGAEEALASHASLSLREREVLRLCISGLTVTRIAEMFNRSLKTVSTQKLAAYRKLGVTSDMDLFKRLSQYRTMKGL
ncbi:response regulator transcription factor [Pseudomonas sp. P7548]|uniref:response regulator transcription factor n=1 Tax=Pseudomonas sp. P7548 TaxID=2726981 RepID=UPI0015B87347|nr:response regulator transcription factor [Pseudomonas sp. P7548]NWE20685.1 response regulator transcription factor [Pseudomonas sp. P7548]